MNLIINASLGYSGGGLQVALSFIHECASIKGHVYHVFMGPSVSKQVDKASFPDNFHFYNIPSLRFYQFQNYLTRLAEWIDADVVFSIFGPVYWKPKMPHVIGYAIPHYIYYDSPYWNIVSPKEKLINWLKRNIHFWYLKRDATALVCETENVRQRVASLFPYKKTYTVPNTCASVFRENHLLGEGSHRLKHSDRFRLLTVTRYYPHKNLNIIKSVIAELEKRGKAEGVQFVLTIDKDDYQRVFGNGYEDSVVTVGAVPLNEVPDLYRACDAAFLPTLLECYSANYPEAMSIGLPILTSDLGFARTVCHEAALYFDPLNAEDIATKIVKIAEDETLRNQLKEAGVKRLQEFPNAHERALKYLEICSMLAKANRNDNVP